MPGIPYGIQSTAVMWSIWDPPNICRGLDTHDLSRRWRWRRWGLLLWRRRGDRDFPLAQYHGFSDVHSYLSRSVSLSLSFSLPLSLSLYLSLSLLSVSLDRKSVV